MLLSDHGADVVKIEPPGGDPFRGSRLCRVAPRQAQCAGRPPGTSTIDVRSSPSPSRPTSSSRVTAPELHERLGVDADALLNRNPRLVHCSISAYGADAGHRDRPGYDALVAARLGILDEQRGHMGGAIPGCTARSRSSRI